MREIKFRGAKVEEDVVREGKELPIRIARRWGLPLAQNVSAEQLLERFRGPALKRLCAAGAQPAVSHHIQEAEPQHLFPAVSLGNEPRLCVSSTHRAALPGHAAEKTLQAAFRCRAILRRGAG